MKIPSNSPPFMSFWKLTLTTMPAGLLLAPSLVAAQTGCYCAPSAYTFSFDFRATCPPTSFTSGANGVSQSACFISPLDNQSITNLVPVSVTNIQVFEFDFTSRPLGQEAFPGPFADGDSFSYTTRTGTGMVNGADLASPNSPASIQVLASGPNSDGEDIVLTFILVFTNDCNVFPVISGGESAGWLTFAAVTDPLSEFCPAAPGEPTAFPTMAPTFEPTGAPSEQPSLSAIPSTSAPTFEPSVAPSVPPTMEPTMAPVVPTPSPTRHPTRRPTRHPTSFPTMDPTMLPTRYPTSFPTMNPTELPTSIPTKSPTMFPSSVPSVVASLIPSLSTQPSDADPTSSPTMLPSRHPSSNPSVFPSSFPNTKIPTVEPTSKKSDCPWWKFILCWLWLDGEEAATPTLVPTAAPTLEKSDCPWWKFLFLCLF